MAIHSSFIYVFIYSIIIIPFNSMHYQDKYDTWPLL